MNAMESISYLKGLADGLGLDPENKQDKLIAAMLEAMETMARGITELQETVEELNDQVDAVDEDLANLEDDFYEDDEEYDDDDDDNFVIEDDDDDDENYYEVECPACGDRIYLDEEMMEAGSIECPNCKTELEFDGCDDENCGHDHGSDEE